MSAGVFFELVDELVVPPMAALGYHRIGGYENNVPASRGALTARSEGDGTASTSSGSAVPFLCLDFGFEAETDEAMRRVNPRDPETADEMWLSYEPASGVLDLRSWADILVGHADWPVHGDDTLLTAIGVRRRLTVLGEAIEAFIEGPTSP